MAARGEVRRLITLLAEMVAEKRVTQREIDRRLGYGTGVTSRLFREAQELRMNQLLDILAVIQVKPGAFFRRAYPDQDLSARLLSHLASEPSSPQPLSMPANLTPDELTERIKAALRQVLDERAGEGD